MYFHMVFYVKKDEKGILLYNKKINIGICK